MVEKPLDRAPDAETVDDARRVEDVLRRHGIDPARAVEQRDDPESRKDTLQTLLDFAGQVLPADDFERLRRELGKA